MTSQNTPHSRILRVSPFFERWDVSPVLHSVSSQNNRILNISDVETWIPPRHFNKNAIANRLTYHGKIFFAKFVDLLLSWSFHLIPNVHVNAAVNYFSLYGTIQYRQKYRVHINYWRILQYHIFTNTEQKHIMLLPMFTSHHFQRHYQNCQSASTPQSGTSHKICLRGFGGNGSIAWTSAVSHEGCTSNAFKVTMKLQTFLFQMVVSSCISVQCLWKYGFAKSSDNVYAPCICCPHKIYRWSASSERVVETVWRFKGPIVSRSDALYWCQHCHRIHVSLHIHPYDANDNRKICDYS